jgi:pyruvyl transferase EpsO
VATAPTRGSGHEAVPARSAIFLHGGGNFGDIYPRHQTFRESLLRDTIGRPVVQMPQSIHYDDAAAISETAAAIAAHGAFTLLMRDHESRELAERHFDCTVRMCPDMAFALGEIARPVAPERDVLLLLRGDKERVAGTLPALPAGWSVSDWMDEPEDTYPAALNTARKLALRSLNPLDLRREPRRIAYFDALAQRRIDRGVHLLSTARFVITDRLHAHILCTLCGIPHAFLDNYYGKIRRFSAAFDTVWSDVTPAGSMAEAIGAAEAWLERS